MKKLIDFDEVFNNFRQIRDKEYFYAEGKYSPSQVSTDCFRKTFYDIKFPHDFEEKTIRIFAAGDAVHEHIERMMKAFPGFDWVRAEERHAGIIPHKTDRIYISGKFDLLAKINNGGETVLVDVKSCRRLPADVSESHKRQALLYMWLHGITQGAILYVEKNSFQFADFWFEYDHQAVQDILSRVIELHNSVKNNRAPQIPDKLNPRDPMNCWVCRYCSHRERCISNDEVEAYL